MECEYLCKILEENGFDYYEFPNDDTYILNNLQFVYNEPLIDYIEIANEDVRYKHLNWHIYINFKSNVPQEQNFGLNLDMPGYIIHLVDNTCIYKIFYKENDFIEELYRLNSVGLNIKG